jgi:hypothetical protein
LLNAISLGIEQNSPEKKKSAIKVAQAGQYQVI